MNECLQPLTENCKNLSPDGCTSSEVTIENINFLLNNRKKTQQSAASTNVSAQGKLNQQFTDPV